MSIELRLTNFMHLKGKYDRFATVTFRGVSLNSAVLENCGLEAPFKETFNWPLSSYLDEDEYLEIRIFNRNKVFQDRLIGAYRQSLKILVAQGELDNTDFLMSPSHKVLRVFSKTLLGFGDE